MQKYFAALPVALLLAACQGSAVTPAGTNAPTASAARNPKPAAAHAGERRSWMAPDAKKKELVYVSDPINWNVGVYDKSGKQVGLLATDLDYPEGLCVDKSGNVWVANSGKQNMVEFGHGSTKPIATLDDNSYTPVSCSVNPINGDLAVGNILYFREGIEGNVTIFKGATSNYTIYGDNAFYSYYFVGYDDQGNLFFDGTNAQPGANGQFQYAELPSGASAAESITLTGGSVSFPGNVQWDGHEMTVGDQSNAVIYQTSGAQIVGQTPLTGSSDVAGFFINGKTVIGPDAGNDSVEFFHYPKGGKAYKAWTGLTQPVGVVVSK